MPAAFIHQCTSQCTTYPLDDAWPEVVTVPEGEGRQAGRQGWVVGLGVAGVWPCWLLGASHGR